MLQTRVLPLIEVAGTHREMGRQFGEQLRSEINEYSDMWLSKASRVSGVSRDDLLDRVAAASLVIEQWAPQLADEVRGVAEGARISERLAFSIQLRQELRYAGPPELSCTTFAVTGDRTATDDTYVGQNVDMDAEVEPFGVIIRMKPDDSPTVLMYTNPGLVSYIGLNDAGVAVHGNMLFSGGWRTGFPRYLITRLMLEQRNVDDAITAGMRPPRASSRNFMMGDAAGTIANAEVTVNDYRVLRSDNGELVHTNHYTVPELEACDQHCTDNSLHRYQRMTELMVAADHPLTVDELKGFFRDHEGYPGSICAHVRPGFDGKTIASLISEPNSGRMNAAFGSPCQNDYVVYSV